MMSEEDPLEELFQKVEKAEESGQKLSKRQKRQQEIKQELRDMVDDLEQQEVISESESEAVLKLIEEGKYGRAREEIQEYQERDEFQFSAEEKNLFAEKFESTIHRMDDNIEKMKNSLVKLRASDMKESDFISFLFGKHDLRKGDIEKVFHALDDLETSSFSTDEKARILSAMEYDLNKGPAKEVLKAIQQEAK